MIELVVVVAIILALIAIGGTWMASYLKNSKRDSTASSMGVLLVIADTLKTQAPIKPDHRLANYYWVDTNLTDATNMAYDATTSPTSRQMSSGELLVFLAGTHTATATQIEHLGKYLSPTLGAGGVPVPAANFEKVLVYEQAPYFETAAKKQQAIATNLPAYTQTKFRLISPLAGWRLRSFFDAWGREMIYRYYTEAVELNGTANTLENIVGDAQLSPAVEAKADGAVRPAVAAYGFPSIASAGPDGRWGAFTDGAAPAFARDARADPKTARDADAQDNLYSEEKNR